MKAFEICGLEDFLRDYPSMSIIPCCSTDTILRGKFRFKADVSGSNEIEDFYELQVSLPDKFSWSLPLVKEVGGKIPRTGDFHVNSDGSLCLGAPLRLLEQIHEFNNLQSFVDKILVPYLYAVSCKLKYGGSFLFGELAHGHQGLVADCCAMFGLQEKQQGRQVINLLGLRKRIANKNPCPCGCGKKLGNCSFHNKLNGYRKMAPRSWFNRNLPNELNTGV